MKEPTMMRLEDTIRPLVVAVICATIAAGVLDVLVRGHVRPGLPIVLLLTGVGFFVAAVIFVFPVLALMQRSRQPPILLGALWGGAVAAISGGALTGWDLWMRWAVVGVVAGFGYAAAARRQRQA